MTYCIVYMFWAMTLQSFLSCPFPFRLSGGLWPQLSKVLKPVCWVSTIPFPLVSLQRQVVCLLLWQVFISWLVGVQIKVML